MQTLMMAIWTLRAARHSRALAALHSRLAAPLTSPMASGSYCLRRRRWYTSQRERRLLHELRPPHHACGAYFSACEAGPAGPKKDVAAKPE